jgi:hypothetical protein
MKNNNKKIYTILAIFTFLSLFLIVFIISPLLSGIKNDSAELVLGKNKIVTLEAQNFETENFKKNYDTYKSNLEKIDQIFVDPNNPVDFIRFLENTASECSVTSQISLSFSKDSQKTNQNFVILKFYSNGDFSDLLDFSKKIELGVYLIEIENLTIQEAEEKFNANFTIKVFIKK